MKILAGGHNGVPTVGWTLPSHGAAFDLSKCRRPWITFFPLYQEVEDSCKWSPSQVVESVDSTGRCPVPSPISTTNYLCNVGQVY
jgi:hypothetical protein